MTVCLCDSGCDPELFENTLRLRELRLDLEELLAEKKKGAEALKKMCDAVVKKVCFLGLSHYLRYHVPHSLVGLTVAVLFWCWWFCRRRW